MTAQNNWLMDVLEDASRKVYARPAWKRSPYWEEERRKIDERRKDEPETRVAKDPVPK
ncbi:MAG: hypothetical protein IPM54_21670 [Polyangiaceae bacterium]|nr:hypothetical protein [Polyangiaceae bacterium]